SDTGAALLQKYNKLYVPLIENVLEQVISNKLVIREQDHSKATYFGKRTPADGLIDWSWHKERIINWVRAQAFPYPGAFSFYGKDKITIDEVQICDAGFNWKMPNGLILEVKPDILIKVANGVLKLS